MIKVMRKYGLLGIGPRQVLKRIARLNSVGEMAGIPIFAAEDTCAIIRIANIAHHVTSQA